MNKPIIIVLFCLACGLFSCTETEPRSTVTELVPKYKIVKDIHSSSGWLGNSEKLKHSTENINVDNVIYIVENYKKEYGKSVFSAIVRNKFISSDTKADALRHIKNMLLQAMKLEGVYTDDIDKLIDGHIDYENNKFGKMKSNDIDRDIRTIYDRHKQSIAEKNAFTFIPANGKIDSEFNQGNYLGDCWLIATIKSLSLNPKGREMLDDLISIDDDGNVTVQLKGVDKEYSISKEELKGAKELAQGDFDVRAFEISVNRYLHEIGDHTNFFKRTKNMFKNLSKGVILFNSDYDMYNGISILSTAYYILFDLEPDISSHNNTIEKIKSGEYSTIVASNKYDSMDGFERHHVYAVTRADDNYVYLSNPKNPNIELKMAQADFLEYFDCKSSIKL